MKFEFSDHEYDDALLSEFIERNMNRITPKKWTEDQIGQFSDILGKICSLCETKEFFPVVSIVVDDDCIASESYQDCKVIFDVELNTNNHDCLIVECVNIPVYMIPVGFYNIQKNIYNIIDTVEVFAKFNHEYVSDEQKIELLARNIAHYFNGKMYFESKALGAKFELLKRGADRFKWGENDKIQKNIFDIYHFSPVMDHNNQNVDYSMTRDRFFKYGDYRQGEEYKALIEA